MLGSMSANFGNLVRHRGGRGAKMTAAVRLAGRSPLYFVSAAGPKSQAETLMVGHLGSQWSGGGAPTRRARLAMHQRGAGDPRAILRAFGPNRRFITSHDLEVPSGLPNRSAYSGPQRSQAIPDTENQGGPPPKPQPCSPGPPPESSTEANGRPPQQPARHRYRHLPATVNRTAIAIFGPRRCRQAPK